MAEVSAALPVAAPAGAAVPTIPAGGEGTPSTDSKGDGAPVSKAPQEHGWVEKSDYDYNSFMKTGKELAEADAAAKSSTGTGLGEEGWASNAAIYEWDDEFGDVGPSHPELEKQLFGSENHVRTGIKFDV